MEKGYIPEGLDSEKPRTAAEVIRDSQAEKQAENSDNRIPEDSCNAQEEPLAATVEAGE